jgi:hypothetical protein
MTIHKDAWLVYNGEKSIKIDRNKVANTCWYFRNLLEGPFKESKQFTIDINLGTAFSYDAFRCIVRFADEGIFYRDPDDCNLYIEAIQLAISWGYCEFIRVAEDHLIDRGICREEIDVLSRLAEENMPILARLREACDQFAESMSRRDLMPISRCSVESHQIHTYLDCAGIIKADLRQTEWEEEDTVNKMTEEESEELADLREEEERKRHRVCRRDRSQLRIL